MVENNTQEIINSTESNTESKPSEVITTTEAEKTPEPVAADDASPAPKKPTLKAKKIRIPAKKDPAAEKEKEDKESKKDKEEQASDSTTNEKKSAPSENNSNTTNETPKDPTLVFYLKDLKKKTPDELLELAETLNVDNPSNFAKHDLIFVILKKIAEKGGTMIGEGTVEILSDGYGFLRSEKDHYMPGADDIYVSPNQIRRCALRTGDLVAGAIRAPKKGERYFAITKVEVVNGVEVKKNRHRVHFSDLTALYPNERLFLEKKDTLEKDLSPRIVDMVAPLGKGQRALVVAPPRTGKTVLMQNIAHSISHNHPEVHLIVLLVGERPEEVTDMRRSIKGEVVSSTFDEPCTRHVQLAEMVIEKAKRLAEDKKDVVILLDSITRLARAYNNVAPSSGKVLSGGVDSNALQRPKRFFGAARNLEEGGSITIIATALIETGSRMDEVIFEEFKGTGNAEIILDRKVADKRTFPAIDVAKSGTRREDMLIDKATLTKIWVLRRILNPMGTVDAIEFLIDKLKNSKNNEVFFDQMSSGKHK